MMASANLESVALCYPRTSLSWYEGDCIKNLLLFFDSVALLIPRHLADEYEHRDRAMFEPLLEQKLLRLLDPEDHDLVNAEIVEKLSASIDQLIEGGAFNNLPEEDSPFRRLSMVQLGVAYSPRIARAVVKKLLARRLAVDIGDQNEVLVHSFVQIFVLCLLPQLLRSRSAAIGMELSPTTDDSDCFQGLCAFLNITPTVSPGSVVIFDFDTVAPDLSSVPLDEVLSFRREFLNEYKSYARNVRAFAREISLLDKGQRDRAFVDRQEEIRELAGTLKKQGWRAWRKPAAFALTLGGAAWTLKTGDTFGGLLAGAAAAVGGFADDDNRFATPYSYLFRTLKYF